MVEMVQALKFSIRTAWVCSALEAVVLVDIVEMVEMVQAQV
jgi:hypothetical protein